MMQSVEYFKNSNLATSISSDCQPAVRPTNIRSMAPDFSHNKGNRIRFMKLLNHCAMVHLLPLFLYSLKQGT